MASYMITPEIFTNKMNILIYGDPGAGKTHLAGTAQDHPGMANVHVFNIDSGIMTLANRRDIRATDVTSLEQLEEELWKLAGNHLDYMGVRTVVVDNITELQTINLESIVRQELKDRLKKDKFASVDDIFQEDYGKSTKQIARILRGFRDLPMHKIYIAHRKDKVRKGTTIIEESKPSLTEKLGTAVSGYMDFVWYLYQQVVDEEQVDKSFRAVSHRYLLTQPYNNYLAKTRGEVFASALGLVVQDPDLSKIFNLYLKASGLGNIKEDSNNGK